MKKRDFLVLSYVFVSGVGWLWTGSWHGACRWVTMLFLADVLVKSKAVKQSRSWDDVPRRESPDPIRAMKLAYPVLADGTVKFHAMARSETYGPDESATCKQMRVKVVVVAGKKTYQPVHHVGVPSVDCTCGFYAMKRRDTRRMTRTFKKRVILGTMAWYRRRRDKPPILPYALLEVELLGRVLVHEHGYRAGHQRVMKARLDARCACCSRPAVGFFTGKFQVGEYQVLSSTCGCQAPVRYTLADVRNLLGTEVAWDPDRKPLLTMHRRRG